MNIGDVFYNFKYDLILKGQYTWPGLAKTVTYRTKKMELIITQ